MTQYKTGTAALTQNSNQVVGTDTAWASQVQANALFSLTGSGIWYTVQSVTDDTHLVLTVAYPGATVSGAGYQIHRDFTPNRALPVLSFGDQDSASLVGLALSRIDAIVGPKT